MTEEELRKGLMLLLATHYNGVDFVKPHVRDIAYRAADKILFLLKEAGWKPSEEAETLSKWFEKGRKSVLRENPSGCSCLFDEQDNIVQVCGAHQDWYEEKTKGWKSPEDLKKEHLETPWQRYVDDYYRDKGE